MQALQHANLAMESAEGGEEMLDYEEEARKQA